MKCFNCCEDAVEVRDDTDCNPVCIQCVESYYEECYRCESYAHESEVGHKMVNTMYGCFDVALCGECYPKIKGVEDDEQNS